MIQIIRTAADNNDFTTLVQQLDADLQSRDGADHSFYATFNKVDNSLHVVLLYANDQPVACGAFKQLSSNTVEIKRMFTHPDARGKGFASQVLKELEIWASELCYQTSVLETGKRQPEAIQLYEKNAYGIIPNYGQYAGIDNSVCFEKKLSPAKNFSS